MLSLLRDLARSAGIDVPQGDILKEVVAAMPWADRLELKYAATERLMEEGFDSDWSPNATGLLLEAIVDILGYEDVD